MRQTRMLYVATQLPEDSKRVIRIELMKTDIRVPVTSYSLGRVVGFSGTICKAESISRKSF